MSAVRVVVLSAAMAACSVAELDLAGKRCPCVDGYVCDAATGTCVPSLTGSNAGGSGATSSTGTAGGGAGAGGGSTPSSWKAETSNTQEDLFGVWGSSASDVWVVGAAGTVLHSTGDGQWERTTEGTNNLYGVWGLGGTVYAVGGAGTILVQSGGGWEPATSGVPNDLRAISGNSSGNMVLAVGMSLIGVTSSVGATTWTPTACTGFDANLFSVGVVNDEAWSGGSSGLVLSLPGCGMSISGSETLWGMWSALDGRVYAVGSGGLIRIVHGSGDDEVSGVNIDLRGVWGSSPTDVYAVGDDGTVLHRSSNGSWKAEKVGTTPLYGVWGSGATNVYVVGAGGAIWRGP